MKTLLPTVTLFGLDCINIDRLIQAAEICMKDFNFGKIKLLTSLRSDNINVVAIDPINSIEAYNHFMIKDINSYINTDFVLVIQYDGFILNPSAWSDKFLSYDYIGSPWWENKKYTVGNGGFSLRSKKLLKLLQKDDSIQIPDKDPEDWFISVKIRDYLEKKGIVFAPIELAKQFSFESNEKDGIDWTNQFGFHGLTWTNISKWLRENQKYGIENPLDEWALRVQKKFNPK